MCKRFNIFYIGILLATTNVDSEIDFKIDDLWLGCKIWELNHLDRQWADGEMAAEDEPLLSGSGKGKWPFFGFLKRWF